MKILHVVRRAEGGMKKHVVTLLSELGSEFEQALASTPDFYDSLDDGIKRRTRFVPVDIGDSIGPKTLKQGLALSKQAKSLGTDIIHSHGYKAAVPGVIGAKLSGAKSIVTGHNLFPVRASFPAKASLRFVARLSDRVIAVAPALAKSLTAAGVSEKKITTILNGIDISAYGNIDGKSVRRSIGVDEDAIVVFCAARLTEIKGVDFLIKAAGLLANKQPRLCVVIAGDGPDRAALEELAAQIAGGSVRFLGQRNDVPSLLAAADVVAIPSLAEGHPLIVTEAMASGKAVVASGVGGLVDVVESGETGILVPPADPEALANGISKLLESPELIAGISIAARRYAEEEFTVEQMILKTEEVYRCVVS